MGRQFERVDCSRGAPMGRPSLGEILPLRKIRLFKVRLDVSGYDDGGAYWGLNYNDVVGDVYCATDDTYYQRFTRADSRKEAAEKLGITELLRRK